MIKSDVSELLSQANTLKPKDLIISDLKWKYLLWAVYRRKNILFVGHTRCGKTTAARYAAEVFSEYKESVVTEDELIRLKSDPTIKIQYIDEYKVKYKKYERPLVVFNCGSSQDARAMFIGNTFFSKEKGTYFNQSSFVRAIQTKNAIIVLDELTRITHDGLNILIPVVDPTQRYLRLDESEDSPVISVADGVCFIATANIGSEYTATKVLDKAMAARFPVKVEMLPLTRDELISLISILYPNLDIKKGSPVWNICDISHKTVTELKKDEPRLTSLIPTGAVVEMAQLVSDGFTLEEVAEMTIYPDYPDDGGADSERTFIKQIVEGYLPKVGAKNPLNDPTKKVIPFK